LKTTDFSKDLNKLREDNEKITYDGMQVALILKELDFILVSLHKIGSYYAEDISTKREQYEKETTQFMDNSLVNPRLAKIRTILTQKFNLQEGEDELDDIERICEQIPYWHKPGDYCDEIWAEPNFDCE
jgi:hypothetical protein